MFAKLKFTAVAAPDIAAVTVCSLTSPTWPNLEATVAVAGVPFIV